MKLNSVPLEMPFHMVSFLAEVKLFSFWPKTMDYNKAFRPKLRSLFCGPFTPQWKVL